MLVVLLGSVLLSESGLNLNSRNVGVPVFGMGVGVRVDLNGLGSSGGKEGHCCQTNWDFLEHILCFFVNI